MGNDFSESESYVEVEEENQDMSEPQDEYHGEDDFDYHDDLDYHEDDFDYHEEGYYHEDDLDYHEEPEIPQAIVHGLASLILNKLDKGERSIHINEESVKQVFRALIERDKDEYTLKMRFVFRDKRGHREYEKRISITSEDVKPLKEMYERYINVRSVIRELYEEIENIKERVYSIEDFHRSIKSIQKRLEDEIKSSELYRLYELDKKRDEVIDRIEKDVKGLEERKSIIDRAKGVISNAIEKTRNFLSGLVKAVNPFKRPEPPSPGR